MARRALGIAALIFIPGAVLFAGLIAAWRYVFENHDAQLSAETVRRIRHDCERAARLRELEDARIIRKPTVTDGPATRALSASCRSPSCTSR